MDVLNSFGSEAARDRSDRMRSWYLLEQYRALERNQLDAAEQLQSRSYQEGLLTRELSERRQRRLTNPNLSCGQIHLQDSFSDTCAAEDLYEPFSECRDEDLYRALDTDASLDSDGSVDDSKVDKPLECDCDSGDAVNEDERGSSDDAASVVEKARSPGRVADDIKDQLETVKRDIAQNIQMQLAAFRHSSPPPPSEFQAAVTSTMRSNSRGPAARGPRVTPASNTSVFALWSRLVSFAYQVTQLNHGNCYCDYSSQLLTAVLAFDVLRRGLCAICNVLQPYVSPIKFPTDDEDPDHNIMSVNKKQLTCKWRRKPNKKLRQRSKSKQLHRFENAYRVSYSDELGQHAFLNEYSNHAISEPWRNDSSPSVRDLAPERSFQTYCECCDRPSAAVANPMLKVVQYVDQMLDLDDSKRIF